MERFLERRWLGFIHRVDNLRCVAGHVRLFGKHGCSGLHVYYYGEQAPGWALHRRWNFGLFCLHHVGEGKATDPQGWGVTWARLRFERVFGGFSVTWRWADTCATRKGSQHDPI